MTRSSPSRRIAVRLLIGAAGFTLALPLGAQNIVQQGWNPKEVLAKETYVKPPEIVERIVTAPRNNVAFTNPSPDNKYFLKTESEGLPSIDAFGKPHYRLARPRDRLQGESRPRAHDARQHRSHADRSHQRIDAHDRNAEGRARQRCDLVARRKEHRAISRTSTRPRTSSSPMSRPGSRCSSRRRRFSPSACRASIGPPTERASSPCCCPTNRPAEPKRPAVETGPLVRTSDAGKILKNRNFASLLRDPYDKDLLDYYTMGQLALIDVKTKTVKNIGQPALITDVEHVARWPVLPRDAAAAGRTRTSCRCGSFRTVEQVWDANGKVLAELSKRPLVEGTGRGR